MKITAGRYYIQQGIMPTMELIIDGYPVTFADGIKRSILDNVGAVPMFGYPEAKLPVIKLKPPYAGELHGFTTDPIVVAWVRNWLEISDSLDGFTAGEIDVSVTP